MVINVRGVDENLWRLLRTMAAFEGKSIGEKLNDMLREGTKHIPALLTAAVLDETKEKNE